MSAFPSHRVMVCENKSFTRVEPGRPALTYSQGRSPQVQSLGYFVFERIHRRALFYSWFFLSLFGKASIRAVPSRRGDLPFCVKPTLRRLDCWKKALSFVAEKKVPRRRLRPPIVWTSNQVRGPAEFKHITKRRKRN